MKILITGFEPFNGSEKNSSMSVLDALPNKLNDNIIIKKLLPTEFKKSAVVLNKTIEQFNPDVVICLGEAAGRKEITPETIAFNEDHTTVPDNSGYKPEHEFIHQQGEEYYYVNLQVTELVNALKEAGIPSHLSDNAGRYVCNHIMYECQYLIRNKYPNMKACFIHLPSNYAYKKEMPTLDLNTEISGINIVISTINKLYN
ncbi:Pyrrolidone-carboxylate peptidase [Apilactobacillus kunkeei]|uniref:pyroglutamyl-peptidase I n=1 Tax=Apilactobacillus kunkeei TaxID=148814 RepID=UPI001C6F8A7C|nr:pyroglutamyl-peptidase I [Apilactobacillus kunkeei]MBX8454912.1 pyroglutamyl-peptidase I [Apilactobacillus kunkeei]QYU54462.1 pyroglutamyl-peptidase I [Apilactobacillus kunkeei]CAI2547359.1 Pyrrolidone-carboxylate peptidase [Apilactobacillus kunkeei]CAI2547488.1 Pyrrolidone-carboxylate peptidase [Apilactobacillus kunkeei]CAI2548156.1 Pyrrolidone-carboxylate peptidase [Apilactobacillus kunkeei]